MGRKESIASAMEGQNTKLQDLKMKSLDQVITVATEMVEDGMVEATEMSALIS